jgi:hypothetical protein
MVYFNSRNLVLWASSQELKRDEFLGVWELTLCHDSAEGVLGMFCAVQE